MFPGSASAQSPRASDLVGPPFGAREPSPLSAFSRVRVSPRDQSIIALACRKLGSSSVDFGDALRALREATEELIPAGRTYVLGHDASGPVVGSIISGVGIVPGVDAVLLVHVDRNGRRTSLGSLMP
jgi:hypothetical protein